MDSKINLIDDLSDKLERAASTTEVLYAAMQSEAYPLEVDEMKGAMRALSNLLFETQQMYKKMAEIAGEHYVSYDLE